MYGVCFCSITLYTWNNTRTMTSLRDLLEYFAEYANKIEPCLLLICRFWAYNGRRIWRFFFVAVGPQKKRRRRRGRQQWRRRRVCTVTTIKSVEDEDEWDGDHDDDVQRIPYAELDVVTVATKLTTQDATESMAFNSPRQAFNSPRGKFFLSAATA